jgi:hypothetical protein
MTTPAGAEQRARDDEEKKACDEETGAKDEEDAVEIIILMSAGRTLTLA